MTARCGLPHLLCGSPAVLLWVFSFVFIWIKAITSRFGHLSLENPSSRHVSHSTGRSWPLLCSISSGSFACTPLASKSCLIAYSAALNPIESYQSSIAPSFRSTWHPNTSCACQSFARSSCTVSLLCNAISQLDLPFDQPPRATERKGFPSFASFTGVSPLSFTNQSSSPFDFAISSQSQLCHTLFRPPTATHSVPKPPRISISTRHFFRLLFYLRPKTSSKPPKMQVCNSFKLRLARVQSVMKNVVNRRLRKEKKRRSIQIVRYHPLLNLLSCRLQRILTSWKSEPFGFRHVATNIKGISEDEYVSPSDCIPSCQAPPRRHTG